MRMCGCASQPTVLGTCAEPKQPHVRYIGLCGAIRSSTCTHTNHTHTHTHRRGALVNAAAHVGEASHLRHTGPPRTTPAIPPAPPAPQLRRRSSRAVRLPTHGDTAPTSARIHLQRLPPPPPLWTAWPHLRTHTTPQRLAPGQHGYAPAPTHRPAGLLALPPPPKLSHTPRQPHLQRSHARPTKPPEPTDRHAGPSTSSPATSALTP